MKNVSAIIELNKLGVTMKKLVEYGFDGITVAEVSNHIGQIYKMKVRVDITVPDEDVIRVRMAIINAAHTGHPGDGRITITAVEHFINISTGRDEAVARAR